MCSFFRPLTHVCVIFDMLTQTRNHSSQPTRVSMLRNSNRRSHFVYQYTKLAFALASTSQVHDRWAARLFLVAASCALCVRQLRLIFAGAQFRTSNVHVLHATTACTRIPLGFCVCVWLLVRCSISIRYRLHSSTYIIHIMHVHVCTFRNSSTNSTHATRSQAQRTGRPVVSCVRAHK